MMKRAPTRLQTGFTTVENIAAIGISLFVLAVVANVVMFQYGRGVVRGALDDGVRAGARLSATDSDAVAACQQRAQEVIDAGIPGFTNAVTPTCSIISGGEEIQATATYSFRIFLGTNYDVTQNLSARAHKERPPT